MKKKLLLLLLCLGLCMALMPVAAFAEDTGYAFSDGNLTITSDAGVTNWNTEISDKSDIKTITVGENVTAQLTESMGFDSHLTNLQTITFVCGADLNGAFKNCSNLKSVTFIGNPTLKNGALSGCTALKTLTFKSTSEIIDGSLTGCSALETMTFGGQTHIGNGALSGTGTTTLELIFPEGSSFTGTGVFNNCTGLKSITFEGDITLRGSAFKGLGNLKTVVFEGKSTLEDSAFSNCPKLESVTFKDTTHIKAGALTCDSGAPNTVLTEVEVPDNSTMSGNTFAYYTALKTVKLGKGAYFYWGAFYGADGITDVYFADETPVTFPEKALVYLNPAQVTLHVPTCDAVTAYTEELKKDPVDEADADLHNAAFVSCLVAQDGSGFGYTFDPSTGEMTVKTTAGLTAWNQEVDSTAIKTLIITDGVTTISGQNPFSECASIETVTFKGDAQVSGTAFQGLSSLKEVTFEGNATVEGAAFQNLPKLETVTFKGEVNANAAAFVGCSSLKTVTFEEKATLNSCFYGLPVLETVIFKGESIITSNALNDCPSLRNVTFEQTTKIGDSYGAFYNTQNCNYALEELVIPENSVLKNAAFQGYHGLKTVTLGAGTTVNNAFCKNSGVEGNPALETVTFKGDAQVSGTAFQGLSSLKEVTFEGNATVEGAAFQNLPKLETVTFKGEVNANAAAFVGCSSLKTVTFEEKATLNSCFYELPALETVIFKGESIITSNALNDCPSLRNVTFEQTTKIGDSYGAFYNTQNCNYALEELVIPENSVLKNATFKGYCALKTITFKNGTTIDNRMFEDNPAVTDIYFESATPQTFAANTFDSLDPATLRIHVPCTAVEAYKVALSDTDNANGRANSEYVGCIVVEHSAVVTDAAVEATCTVEGKTAGSHCTACNTILTAQETVLAKGHTEVTDAAVAATCTAEGKTAGSHCSVCGEVLVAQITIEALGHKYGDWTSVDSTQHRRVCENDATHKETANHTFSGNKCDACGYTKSSGGSSGGGGTYVGPTTSSTTTVSTPKLKMELQINNKDYKVNDKTYTYDVAPFIVGDRTMVPVRVIMETLGAKVDWDAATRGITITLDGKVMTMTIGKEIPGYGSAPIIQNSRTYVPIRYIMENAGAKVDWIAATGEIVITK